MHKTGHKNKHIVTLPHVGNLLEKSSAEVSEAMLDAFILFFVSIYVF